MRYGLKDCESQLKNVVGFHARFHQQLKNVNSVSSQGIFPLYLKSKLNKAGLDHFLNCWMILSNKCSQRSVKDFVDLLQLQNLSSVVNPLTQGSSEQEVQKYHVWRANPELVGIHNNKAHEELVEIYNRQTSQKS